MIKTGVEDRVLHFGSIFVHLFCKKKMDTGVIV